MDRLLPGFEPSEADLIQMALDMPLDKKIEKAILFYREFCDGAYGAFSGGKDSCVIKQLGIEAGVDIDWHYNNVTIDPPELVHFIKREHPDVKWNNPDTPLLREMVNQRMPPMRNRRWCCRKYKEAHGNSRKKVLGVRVAESAKRSARWKMITRSRYSQTVFLAPIVYWTDEDVWGYIRDRAVPYCELYDEGLSRLGCIGCPCASSASRKATLDRWPNYKRAWMRAFQRTWDKWKDVPTRQGKERSFVRFGSWEAWFEWWLRDSSDYDDDQCVFEDMMSQR